MASQHTFYLSRHTLWHHMHISIKLSILLLYALLIIALERPVQVLFLLSSFVTVSLLTQLPIPYRAVTGTAVIGLCGLVFYATPPTLATAFGLALGKIASLLFLGSWFNMTTKPHALLSLLSPTAAVQRPSLNSFLYLMSTSLSILPLVQHDLQKAIDTESIRLEKAIRFYQFTTWVNILSVFVIRVLKRADQFAQQVIDRGYSLRQGLRPIHQHPRQWSDWFIGILAIGFACTTFFTL